MHRPDATTHNNPMKGKNVSRSQIINNPDDPRHGTRNGYINLGCRCDACRENENAYRRRMYKRKTSPVEIVSLRGEVWRPVPDFDGIYEVSNHGRVRSLDRIVTTSAQGSHLRYGQILVASKKIYRKDKRLVVLLTRNRKRTYWPVHRLVATVFIGPQPEGMECCHNDGDPTNNHVSNLRWDTSSANARDTVRHGRHPLASRSVCHRGHEFTPENTYVSSRGHRKCRACDREKKRIERMKGEAA